MDVVFAGCGALGSWVAMMLAVNTQLGTALLLDDDVIGEENLVTTPYYAHQVGVRKVIALAEMLCRKGIDAVGIHGTVSDPLNLRLYGISHGNYIIVDTFDNRDARLCTRGPSTVHAGVSVNRTGAVVWDARWTPPPPVGLERGNNPICTRHAGAQILQLTAAHTACAIRAFIEIGSQLDTPMILESGEAIR